MGKLDIQVVPVAGKSGWWDVVIGGKLLGMVERCVINVHGSGPEYLAHYLVGREQKTYPSSFHGETAMTYAVAMIAEKARV